ncbi:chemotaxis protein CheW [Sphingomonas phyllosphaerae]|jgi:purine-binding chemotaxis protein CheW|uniref:chemotaxis protein CheW n=1 Tax=Sphingomonas phyllosphaerae TaxID=257003 RepID=UPI0003B6644D|nr:chemotaxis protein CheW [Sphingomonas phyllosphaerae]
MGDLRTQQLITFELGGQVLGVDVMAIREIRAWSAATPLPNSPAHICGVVNLRGIVLPVIDLRMLLGWGLTEPSPRHVIIVLELGHQMQGMIVDAVNDIVSIDRDAMQPPPDLGDYRNRRVIEGIVTVDERLVTVMALAFIEAEQFSMVEAA